MVETTLLAEPGTLELFIAAGPDYATMSLEQCECIIARGHQTFIAVGQALLEIRDRRLYRETHATFEAYCRERWGFKRVQAHNYISAAKVVENVHSNEHSPLPSLTQAVQLAPLPPEAQREVAERVDFSTATVRDVKQEVAVVRQKWQGDKGVLINTGEDDWPTPPHIVTAVVDTLRAIDLDPCASPAGEVPASTLYTESDDGLSQPWFGRVYMNPPYGRPIERWVEKLTWEYEEGDVSAFVALVPARTDTKWFQKLRNCDLCLIRGRLTFGDAEQGAPFPSCAAYRGPLPDAFAAAFSQYGDVWRRVTP